MSSATPAYRTCTSLRPVPRVSCISPCAVVSTDTGSSPQLHSSAAQPRAALTYSARSAFRKNRGSSTPTHEREKQLSTAPMQCRCRVPEILSSPTPPSPLSTRSHLQGSPRRAAPRSKIWAHPPTCQTPLSCSVRGPSGAAEIRTFLGNITEARAPCGTLCHARAVSSHEKRSKIKQN